MRIKNRIEDPDGRKISFNMSVLAQITSKVSKPVLCNFLEKMGFEKDGDEGVVSIRCNTPWTTHIFLCL